MKQKNNFLSLAILGSLFALSCIHSHKIQGRIIKPQESSATMSMNPIKQNQPIDIKSEDELNKHLTLGKPVVLMIHASWCGACKVSMDPFAQSAEDNPQVSYLKVEGSKDVPEIANKYQLRGFPLFILFDAEGKQKHKFSGGGWPKSVLNQKVKEHISK